MYVVSHPVVAAAIHCCGSNFVRVDRTRRTRHTESSNTLYSTLQQLRYNWLLLAELYTSHGTYIAALLVASVGQCMCEINKHKTRHRSTQTQCREPTKFHPRLVFPRPPYEKKLPPHSSTHSTRKAQRQLASQSTNLSNSHTFPLAPTPQTVTPIIPNLDPHLGHQHPTNQEKKFNSLTQKPFSRSPQSQSCSNS